MTVFIPAKVVRNSFQKRVLKDEIKKLSKKEEKGNEIIKEQWLN